MYRLKTLGFSLVELAITLVIISLIIAAITSGNYLLKAARINKVISEISGYKSAIDNFKQKYQAMPGDMPNAVNFWPNSYNGNGNEKIEGVLTESLWAWQHLKNANMIAGNYNGIKVPPSDFAIDINVPKSTIDNTYYFISYDNFYGHKGNNLQLVTTSNNLHPTGGAISASDASIIDKKLDKEANSANGNFFVVRAEANKNIDNSCVSSNYEIATTTSYVNSDYTESCRLVLWLE